MLYSHNDIRKDPEIAIKIIDALVACGDQVGILMQKYEAQIKALEKLIETHKMPIPDTPINAKWLLDLRECVGEMRKAKSFYSRHVCGLLDSIAPSN